MKLNSIVGAYSIIIGIMMAGMWLVFAAAGQIPEIDTKPREIAFHLAAEFITAFALVAGGLGLALRRRWGYPLNMAALGMLGYSVVVSPGYYAQREEYAFVGMFALLMALTIGMIATSIWKREDLQAE